MLILAQRLHELLAANGLSQLQLARRAECSTSVVSDLLSGKQRGSIELLECLAKALSISLPELLDGTIPCQRRHHARRQVHQPRHRPGAAESRLIERIRYLQDRHRLTDEDLSRRAAIPPRCLRAILEGRCPITLKTLDSLACGLGVPRGRVLSHTGWQPPRPASARRPGARRRPAKHKETVAERNIRRRLRQLWKRSGKTGKEVAAAIRVRRSSFSSVLGGWRALPPTWVPALLVALDASRAELFGKDRLPTRRRGRPKGARRASAPTTRRNRTPRFEHPSEWKLRERIRVLSASKHKTQRALASEIRVSNKSLSAVLCGQVAIPPTWLSPIAETLAVSYSELVRGTGWTPAVSRRRGRPRRA